MRLAVMLCVLTGCGVPGGSLDPAHDGGEVASDGGAPPPDAHGDPDAAAPVARRPCETTPCWETELATPECSIRTVDEDFSTGRYAVHRWAVQVWAGRETGLRLERTGGEWQPAIVVTEADGTVVYDGERGAERPDLRATALETGRAGAVAEVAVHSDADRALWVYATGWHVVDSGFTSDKPMDATYRFEAHSECEGVTAPCVVNGNPVDEPACGWLHHIAREIVPQLDGTRDEALTAAARVGWWSLKEGVLFLPNPIVYSNCNTSSGDRRIGPLDVCEPRRAWQVGMAGVQVPSRELDELEAAATRLHATSSDHVLDRVAREAAVDAATRVAIIDSTGDLRRSWLLRDGAVGFTFQAPRVTSECVESTRDWCDGTGWRETRLFAPDRAAAARAIADVRAILDAVAP